MPACLDPSWVSAPNPADLPVTATNRAAVQSMNSAIHGAAVRWT